MSESRRGIINGAETATSVPCDPRKKPEEPYDPQQTSTQRAGDPSVLKNPKIQGYSKPRNPDTQTPS